MEPLDVTTVDRELEALPGWRREGGAIVREFRLGSFRAAIDLIVRVADLADAADHHPELTNVYDRVSVRLSTHEAGGITRRDLELAASIDGAIASDGPDASRA